MKDYVEANIAETFVCYTANADLTFLLTLGVDVRKLNFIDLFVAFRQLTYTHPKSFLYPQMRPPKPGNNWKIGRSIE